MQPYERPMRADVRKVLLVGMLSSSLLAPGCTTAPSAEKLALARNAVAESPTLRKKAIDDCTTKIAATDPVNLKLMSDLARVPLTEYPRFACERFTNAWINGTIPDEMFQRFSTRTLTAEDNAKIARIVTGLDPG